jgi:hypothetical protein
MAKATRRYRAAWEDRFAEPTWEDLSAGLPKELHKLCERLRQTILGERSMKEQVRWCGLPWRWSLTFLGNKRDDLAWAYLVPNPESPALGIPLPAELAHTMEQDTDSRRIRDTLTGAKRSSGVAWSSWPLSTPDELEDALTVITRKLEFEQA